MGPPRFSSASRRALVACVAVAVFGVGLWLLGGNHGSPGAPLTEAAIASVDRPAPGFTQSLISKKGSLSLARYEGRVVVLNFWASWCTACRSEASELEGLRKSYGGQGVQFVGVDYEDRRSAAINFARSHNMSYPSAFDPNGTVGDAYGILGLPTTYIITPDHRIRYVVYGKIHVASFRVALDSVLRTTASDGSSP